jgi:DNA-binding CsgD family transcriptional regulator
MKKRKESDFAEVNFERILLESFPLEKSAYFKDKNDLKRDERFEKIRSKVYWHINHSLSRRQKQVMKLLLLGKKQAEIGRILGIKQQVVYIYKKRAIKKLRSVI